MIQDLFKTKLPVKIIAAFFLMLQSCHNGEHSESKPSEEKDTGRSVERYDSNSSPYIKPGNNASNHFESPAEAEKEERRRMILMQIDSTYTAISLLDDAKNEMTSTSPAELTAAERNKKSKAIFNINILQNELTRSLDASILANLRLKTDELAGITAEMEKNVTHLQSVTEKLNKATQCIGRLTNILALGLSKGIIKPLTPKNSSAEAVKETAVAN
ncbi:hypothetical protein [Ferruginibacter sp.]